MIRVDCSDKERAVNVLSKAFIGNQSVVKSARNVNTV